MTVSSTITIKQATELATSDPTQLPEIHEVLSRRIIRGGAAAPQVVEKWY